MEDSEFRKRMTKRMMDPKMQRRAERMAKGLERVVRDEQKYEQMSNEELAFTLMNEVWAKLPVFSHDANLLDAVIERLHGCKNGE